MAALQEKLNQSNNKVADFRNQCEKLKKELRVAHKVRKSISYSSCSKTFRISFSGLINRLV